MKKDGSGSMISRGWIKQTRAYFLAFLRETGFPEIKRQGERGGTFQYPEWLIMLIGVVAVKCKEKTYVGIHRLATRYWEELCGSEVKAPPMSERQLRERLKKISFRPGTGAGYIYQIFPAEYLR